jgi:hypothetical protein
MKPWIFGPRFGTPGSGDSPSNGTSLADLNPYQPNLAARSPLESDRAASLLKKLAILGVERPSPAGTHLVLSHRNTAEKTQTASS